MRLAGTGLPARIVVLFVAIAFPFARGHGASNTGDRRIVTVGRPIGPGTVMAPAPMPRPRPRPRARSIPIVRDRALQAWVQGVFEALAIEGDDSRRYRITILEDDKVNAAVLADGHILVLSGLLAFVKSDDELAGVLAHECAHVELRHHPKRAGKGAFWQTLFTLAAAAAKNLRGGFLGAQVAAQAMTMSYSRKQELAADRWALERILAAGYNPTAMVDFLERLREKEAEQPGFLATFMMSHPLVSTRIREVRRRIPHGRSYGPKVLSFKKAGQRAFRPVMERRRSFILTGAPGSGRAGGNLLADGDFERLPSEELPIPGWTLDGRGAARRDTGRAYEGRACLRLRARAEGTVRLSSDPFPLTSAADLDGHLWLWDRERRAAPPRLALLPLAIGKDGAREASAEGENAAVRAAPDGALPLAVRPGERSGPWLRMDFRVSGRRLTAPFRRARLVVESAAPETVWIDGLVLRPRGELHPGGGRAGNLVPRGDFEGQDGAALPEGWVVERGTARLDEEKAGRGRKALILRTVSTGQPTTIASPVFPLDGPSDLMVAGLVRAVNPGVRCWLGVELFDARRRSLRRVFGPVAQFAPAGDWASYRKVFFWGKGLPEGARFARFLVEVAGRGEGLPVWVDELALVSVQNGGGRCPAESAPR